MTQIVLAGQTVPHALDSVRRYCGLPWSGGPPEVWAYPYFDALPPGDPVVVTPIDVLATAALHPGLSRTDLEFFISKRQVLSDVLAELPMDLDLGHSAIPLELLTELRDRIGGGCGLSLLTKVLHRKRPRLVPMFDRSLTDWYRQRLSSRGEGAWGQLVEAMSADLGTESNLQALAAIGESLSGELAGPVPSRLRLADIAIWMAR